MVVAVRHVYKIVIPYSKYPKPHIMLLKGLDFDDDLVVIVGMLAKLAIIFLLLYQRAERK